MTNEVKVVATGTDNTDPITQKLTTQEAHLMLKIHSGETHLMSIPTELTQDFEKLLAKGFVKVDGVRAALTLHGHAFIHGLETHIANWV